MSIEKMNLLNLVGHKDELDKVSKLMVLSNAVHIVNGMDDIDSIESAAEETIDTDYIKPYSKQKDYSSLCSDIKKIREMSTTSLKYEPKEEELIFEQEHIEEQVKQLKAEFCKVYNKLMETFTDRDYILQTLEHMKLLSNLNISFEEIDKIKNFSFEVYKISKEKALKLKGNYENIPAIVKSIFMSPEYEIIIVLIPNILKEENDKIIKSLNCENISLPKEFTGRPKKIIKTLEDKLVVLKEQIDIISNELEKLSNEKVTVLSILEKSLELELRAEEIRNSVACTNEFFYFGGWIPNGKLNEVNESLGEQNEKLIIMERDSNKVDKGIIPPTKLKNNAIVRPFEAMVGMYGIPSYSESDPTAFLAISYMLLFGAMFGDLGQGLVFVLMGIYLKYKQYRTNLGPLLVRLGISSSIFGLIYGSFFGFEDVIPALVIRPMENISETLLCAIGFGCCLIVIGYIYNMVNNMKKKNLEEGIFGKNGAAGLILYLSLLSFGVLKVLNIDLLPNGVWFSLFGLLLLITLFKEPLANLIEHKRPLHKEGPSEYYIEGSFGIVECLLSIFSNTLSFVRVGAFALNHVGLFLAFAALANMIHNRVGGAFMYILGNLIIIGIEGLVVFIQGMRLEYYELFSKYFEGEGVAYEPVKLTAAFKFKENKLIQKIKSLKNRQEYSSGLSKNVEIEK